MVTGVVGCLKKENMYNLDLPPGKALLEKLGLSYGTSVTHEQSDEQ